MSTESCDQGLSGKSTRIDLLASYDSDSCYSLLGTVKIVKQAAHGRLTLVRTKYRLQRGFCKGRVIKVVLVNYRSNRRYRGQDQASIRYQKPPRSYDATSVAMPRVTRYRITVK